MRLSSVALCVLVAFAGPVAFAERFTHRLDNVAQEVSARDAELGEPENAAEHKLDVAFTKVLQELAKDTNSLAADLKSAAKVTKRLTKALPDDGGILELLESAASGYASSLAEDAASLRVTLAGAGSGRAARKAGAALDKAAAQLETALSESDPNKVLRALRKAEHEIAKARKLLQGAGPSCEGRALAAGESLDANYGDAPFVADSVEASLAPGGGGGISFHRCSVAVPDFLSIAFSGTPPVNEFLMVSAGPSAYVISHGSSASPFDVQDATGTLVFTEVDTTSGTYAGNFDVTIGGVAVSASFRVRNVR